MTKKEKIIGYGMLFFATYGLCSFIDDIVSIIIMVVT